MARQWRPSDLRGLPMLLRYGASLPGVALAAARSRPRQVVLVDACGPMTGAEFVAAVDAVAELITAAVGPVRPQLAGVVLGNHRGLVTGVVAAGSLGIDAVLVPPSAGTQVIASTLAGVDLALIDAATGNAVRTAAPLTPLLDLSAVPGPPADRPGRRATRPRRTGSLRLLTSGTTGAPKATDRGRVGVTQLATLVSLLGAFGPRRGEPLVIAPPLAHGHGLSALTAALVVGAPAVLGHGRDGTALAGLVRDHEAGALTVVPAQLARLVDALEAERDRAGTATRPLTSLRRIATGSAPLPTELVRRTARLLGDRLVDFYGTSEAGTATIATATDLRQAPGSVGRPAAGVRVEIVGDDGAVLPAGVVGRVRVGSPWRASSVADRAVLTGDFGRLDHAGRLFLDGRVDDTVVIGGHNVSLRRVREWFARQPGVRAVTVEPVPHPELGQELEVSVTGQADVVGLRARALAELGPAAAPRRVRQAR
ncbi:AMP-binding protein [Microlunatus sp. Y2014]|uniref:AMP-binding protein n=1 Tax=Microlunatus sp. Y2014 TaxID=3418488 RepID=UPI003DA74600